MAALATEGNEKPAKPDTIRPGASFARCDSLNWRRRAGLPMMMKQVCGLDTYFGAISVVSSHWAPSLR
jgi:hypothetical protein